MGIDIRLPLGLMFAIVGFILWVYGWLGDKTIYTRSLGINVNLIWGVVLFFFGVVMLVFGWLGKKKGEGEPNAGPDRSGRH